MTQEQKKFIERVGALAAADMQKSGVLASLTIAQAILESGWGKSGLTVKGNALFGIDRDGPFPGLWQLGGKRRRSFRLAFVQYPL